MRAWMLMLLLVGACDDDPAPPTQDLAVDRCPGEGAIVVCGRKCGGGPPNICYPDPTCDPATGDWSCFCEPCDRDLGP